MLSPCKHKKFQKKIQNQIKTQRITENFSRAPEWWNVEFFKPSSTSLPLAEQTWLVRYSRGPGENIFLLGQKNGVTDIFEGQFVGGANITDGGVNIIGRGRGSWTGFWWGTSLVGREGSQGPNSLVLEIHQSHHSCSIYRVFFYTGPAFDCFLFVCVLPGNLITTTGAQ